LAKPPPRPGWCNPKEFSGKFWLYALERSKGAHLFFELPFIALLLNAPTRELKRWIGMNGDQWEKILRVYDFEDGCFNRGSQGAQTRANWREMPLVGSEIAILTAEPIGSAALVTVALCHFAVPINDRYAQPGDLERAAEALCFAFCRLH
jgi:hypothetical protein